MLHFRIPFPPPGTTDGIPDMNPRSPTPAPNRSPLCLSGNLPENRGRGMADPMATAERITGGDSGEDWVNLGILRLGGGGGCSSGTFRNLESWVIDISTAYTFGDILRKVRVS